MRKDYPIGHFESSLTCCCFSQTLLPTDPSQHYLYNLQVRVDANQHRKILSLDPRTGNGQIICLDCHS